MDESYRETRRGDILTITYGALYGQRNLSTGRHAAALPADSAAQRTGAGSYRAEWGPVYYGGHESVDSVSCPDRATALRLVRAWVAGCQAGATR